MFQIIFYAFLKLFSYFFLAGETPKVLLEFTNSRVTPSFHPYDDHDLYYIILYSGCVRTWT